MCRMYLKHFKMEPIKHAINVIKLCMFLASLAIRGAFYLVPVCKVSRTFLKFMHKGEASQFDAIPDGYNDAMRLCNKNLKPPFAYFREQGPSSAIYVVDTPLGNQEFQKSQANI